MLCCLVLTSSFVTLSFHRREQNIKKESSLLYHLSVVSVKGDLHRVSGDVSLRRDVFKSAYPASRVARPMSREIPD